MIENEEEVDCDPGVENDHEGETKLESATCTRFQDAEVDHKEAEEVQDALVHDMLCVYKRVFPLVLYEGVHHHCQCASNEQKETGMPH